MFFCAGHGGNRTDRVREDLRLPAARHHPLQPPTLSQGEQFFNFFQSLTAYFSSAWRWSNCLGVGTNSRARLSDSGPVLLDYVIIVLLVITIVILSMATVILVMTIVILVMTIVILVMTIVILVIMFLFRKWRSSSAAPPS